jgi:hypothetical protein
MQRSLESNLKMVIAGLSSCGRAFSLSEEVPGHYRWLEVLATLRLKSSHERRNR